jgi:two-component system sensor histidine kinase UhpB
LNTSSLDEDGSFSRQYRAALLDYLLGSGESGRERAYELGRRAVNGDLGPLHILVVHQQAVNSILELTGNSAEALHQLRASQEFLMEALSPIEMACRGYVALIHHAHDEPRRRTGAQPDGDPLDR